MTEPEGEMNPASLTAVARHWLHVREVGGPNKGAFVEFLQRFNAGHAGDAWCADFVSVVLEIAYHGAPPLQRTGSTQRMLGEARAKGLVVSGPPVLEDIYFFVSDVGTPHHVGIVTGITPLTGIAGNTSEDGLSSNGTGVFEHVLNVAPAHIVFVRLPR